MFYLLGGVALGPWGVGLIRLDPARDAKFLEVVTEIAVLVSLFTTGLKLAAGFRDRRWAVPVRLATVSMTVTVALVAAVGVFWLGLPLGAAVLLGAILAPTDPVLASDVQVEHHEDRDKLRFGLSGEAGLNDGTAFPFVYLGLGLLGLHEIGAGGWRWVAGDVIWAVSAGLLSGYALGWAVSRLVLYLRRVHREAVGRDEFLTLGLIALSYAVALLLHAYGFLAVFAAGLALRRVEQAEGDSADADAGKAAVRDGETADGEAGDAADAAREKEAEEREATDPEAAPAHLAREVLTFNEQMERIGEAALVLLVGGLLASVPPPPAVWWFVPLLFCVVRPLAVLLGLLGAGDVSRMQRGLLAWFGIRGIGSLYYLAYAVTHELPDLTARALAGYALWTVAASVVLHGVSVTPLMRLYQRKEGGKEGDAQGEMAEATARSNV
jgi:sodium/hydrogen antiporter